MACFPNLARFSRLWLRLLLAAGLALHGAAAVAGPDGGGTRPAGDCARWGDAAALPALGEPRPGLRFAGKAAKAGPDGMPALPPALPPRPPALPAMSCAAGGWGLAARLVHVLIPAARAPPGLPLPA